MMHFLKRFLTISSIVFVIIFFSFSMTKQCQCTDGSQLDIKITNKTKKLIAKAPKSPYLSLGEHKKEPDKAVEEAVIQNRKDLTNKVRKPNRFETEGLDWIIRQECGEPCKQLCIPEVPFGFNCLGVTSKANPNFYIKALNRIFHMCHYYIDKKNKDLTKTKDENIGTNTKWCEYYNLRDALGDYYKEKYYKTFSKCPFSVAMNLTDSAVLSGPRTAVHLFQKVHGLKVDGIFGRQSIEICRSKFRKSDFLKARLARLRGLKLYKKYGKTWERRVEEIKKQF